MLDIRLDFITDIDTTVIEKMKEIREMVIELDKKLCESPIHREAAKRAHAIARTNFEAGLQYAIKCLCIEGEQQRLSPMQKKIYGVKNAT